MTGVSNDDHFVRSMFTNIVKKSNEKIRNRDNLLTGLLMFFMISCIKEIIVLSSMGIKGIMNKQRLYKNFSTLYS